MGAVRKLVDELRRRGVTVHEWSGWDGRGNEGVAQIDPKGAILHHTATGYGSAFAGLVSSTRPDLYGGALCNFSGNADGSVTVIASGLAWHAGAGAGPSLGPLAPYRSRMNYYTVGLEIVYPGDKPMTDAQMKTAKVFAKAVADLFGGGNIEVVRAHAETNGNAPGGDGKWDPGFGPGQTIDMTKLRREALALQGGISQEDELSAEAERKIDLLYKAFFETENAPYKETVIDSLRAIPARVWDTHLPVVLEDGTIYDHPAGVLVPYANVAAWQAADKESSADVQLSAEQLERLQNGVRQAVIDASRPEATADYLAERMRGITAEALSEVISKLQVKLGFLPTGPTGL